MNHRTGLPKVTFWTQCGMFSTGRKNPESSRKNSRKNQMMKSACYWVRATVEVKMPMPREDSM
jgi:hypothetical protein